MGDETTPEPGAFYKDNPDGTVHIDGGGFVDVWTSAPDENGRRKVHLSLWGADPDSESGTANALYSHYVTYDGEDF